jgi:rod shape-determining protein MreD
MRTLGIVALVIAALTLESTVLAFDTFRPRLATALVVYIALSQPLRRGVILAFLLGYAEDLFMGTPRGLHAFCAAAVYLAFRPAHDKIRLEGVGTMASLGFFAALFSALIETLLRRVFLASFSISLAYLGGLILAGFSTAIFAPLVLKLVQRLARPRAARDESLLARARRRDEPIL